MRKPLGLAASLAGAILLALPAAALAHANLVRSEPQANANAQQPPGRVQLWFSEHPELKLTQIQVFDSQRREVQTGPTAATDDPLSLTEQLQPNLSQGVYTVSWRTTSAVDGHVTGGAFAFGIGVAPTAADLAAAAQAAAQPPPSPISVIIRWLEYLSAVGLLGVALFGLLVIEQASLPVRQRQDELDRRLVAIARVLAGLLVMAVLFAMLDQTRLSGASLPAVLGTATGENLLARLLAAIAALAAVVAWPESVTVAYRHRSLGAAAASALPFAARGIQIRRGALITALLAELLLFALSSHAQAVAHAPELALVNDWLHLTVAGVWVGGLIALAVAVVPAFGGRTKPGRDVEPRDFERNQVFGPLVAAFSRIALISAIGLAVTGFYQALVHVGSVENALDTPFGQTLIVKSAIFLVALLLAGFHRWMLVPVLREPARVPATRARRFLSRTLPIETLLVAGVLAATGLLTSLAPANSAGSATAQVRALGSTRVVFDVVPLRVGSNLFQVSLTSKGKPVNDAQKVELQLTMLDMDMGQGVVDLEPRGGGVYSAESDLLSMGGRWQFELLLRLPGELDQRTIFDVVAKA